MAIYHTPILTGARVNAATFNGPLQQLDNAIGDRTPLKWFNIQDYGAVPSTVLDNSTAIKEAMYAASDWAQAPARGGVVYIPPGIYSTGPIVLTDPLYNVCLLGSPTTGGSGVQQSSVIRGLDNTAPVFTLGNNLASHLKMQDFLITGASGTNLNHRGISAASIVDFQMVNMFLHGFGGSAVYLGGGGANVIKNLFVTGSLIGHAGLADYAGVVEIHGSEIWWTEGNINGPSGPTGFNTAVVDGGKTHLGVTGGGIVGGGPNAYVCGLLTDCQLLHLYHTTFAFCHYGARLGLGFGHDIAHNRFEFNQRHGLWTGAIRGRYGLNRFHDNSQEADGTYAHIKIGGLAGPTNGYNNTWMGNEFHAVNYTDYIPNYGFDIQASGGVTWNLRNELSGNLDGGGIRLALVTNSGSPPVTVAPEHFDQQIDLSTNGQTATFDAQKGDIFRLHLTSAAATATVGVPNYPLENSHIVMEIWNQTGGAVTVTFNAVFKTSGFTNPANGKYRTARFYYNGTNWMQIGDWSGDL